MTPNASKTRKIWFVLLKIVAALVIFVLLCVATVFAVDGISSASEQKRLQPYGQHVTVDGKQMNVLLQGDGEDTIVLLPGYGNAAPGLDFQPLIDALATDYRVVVVEPFGYGLSDPTDAERSTENIVHEIHAAVHSLGIDRYTLMAHSISGLYSLDYVNRYPQEVTAFVGLDSSVPSLSEQQIEASDVAPIRWFRDLGFDRLQLKLSADPYEGLAYDEKVVEQLHIMMRRNMYNDTQLNEVVSMYSNFQTGQQQSFPVDLPVLFFLQANHPAVAEWIPEHEKQIANSERAEVVLLDANHYLYRSHPQEIAEGVRAFIKKPN
ncbi:alpha/beta hydrolase [Saccharibacillus sacchari]|uniref:Alpha/beta hydrolase n=1 Tax=Saccharibacillus sacchari TaxID=456493 RepID=A0ACC6P9B0_9BACL